MAVIWARLSRLYCHWSPSSCFIFPGSTAHLGHRIKAPQSPAMDCSNGRIEGAYPSRRLAYLYLSLSFSSSQCRSPRPHLHCTIGRFETVPVTLSLWVVFFPLSLNHLHVKHPYFVSHSNLFGWEFSNVPLQLRPRDYGLAHLSGGYYFKPFRALSRVVRRWDGC